MNLNQRKWKAGDGTVYIESNHSDKCFDCALPVSDCSTGIFERRPKGCSTRGTIWKKYNTQDTVKVETIEKKGNLYSPEEVEAFEQLLKIPSILQIFQIRLSLVCHRPQKIDSEWAMKELINATASQIRIGFNWTKVDPLHVLRWMKEYWYEMNLPYKFYKKRGVDL